MARRGDGISGSAAFSQRAFGLIAAGAIEQIEHHQQGRRGHLLRVGIAQPFEP
jgi:hypothetical protein